MYGKLFKSTFTGSMYGKGPIIVAVWSYVIANKGADGLVELNADLIAHTIGQMTGAQAQGAIDFLSQPDPNSRTKDEAGSRLVREGEFIYRVVNHEKYAGIRNEVQRREWERDRKALQRKKKKGAVPGCPGHIGTPRDMSGTKRDMSQMSQGLSHHIDVDVDINKSEDTDTPSVSQEAGTFSLEPEVEKPASRKGKSKLPSPWPFTPDRLKDAAAHLPPDADAAATFAAFCDHWWAKGELKADWAACWRTWCRNAANGYGYTRKKPSPEVSSGRKPAFVED